MVTEPGCMSKYQILEAVGRGVSPASGPATAEIPPSFAPVTPIIKQRNPHPLTAGLDDAESLIIRQILNQLET